MKRLYFLLVLLTTMAMAWGTSQTDDTFHQRLKAFDQAEGKERVEAANRFFKLLEKEQFVDPTVFTEKTPRDTVSMNVWYYAAEYLTFQQKYEEAIDYAGRALPLAKGNGDYTWQAECLNLLVLSHFHRSNWTKALEYSFIQLDTEQRNSDDSRAASTLKSIASIYLAAHQPKEAEKYILLAEKKCKDTDETGFLATISGVAAEVFLQEKDYDRALSYAQQAYDLSHRDGQEEKGAVHLSQMGAVRIAQGEGDKALPLVQQAIAILKKSSNRRSLGICLNQMGDILCQKKQYHEAADYFQQACRLLDEVGDGYNKAHSLHGLYESLYLTRPEEAKTYLDQYILMRDSLYNNDVKTMLSNYNAKFRNDELQQEKENTHREYQKLKTWSIAAAAILLLALAFLAYAVRLKSKTNKTLRDLQRVRESFFTNITHEFRTPLTLILGMSQKMKEAKADNLDDIHEAGDIVGRAGNRLLQLINQLLDIAKVQSSATHLDWRRGNIVAYLGNLLEGYRPLADMKGIEVVYAHKHNDIQADFVPDYFQKIIANLLSNALKYTPEHGRVSISLAATGYSATLPQPSADKNGNGHLILTVADSGIGIDSKDLPHIFDPFYQGCDTRKDIGTGVGLSLVKQTTEAMNGTVSVESTPGKGTVFTVTLPLRAKGVSPMTALSSGKPVAKPAMPAADSNRKTEERQAENDSRHPRILIVEDNNDVAYYIGNQLESRYDVFFADNGQVGLEKAERLIPDLVITDLIMPEMDGLELCRQIRQSDIISHIPIIIITAKTSEEERVRGLEAGADAYLFKPFNSDELNMRIRKLLGQRQLLR